MSDADKQKRFESYIQNKANGPLIDQDQYLTKAKRLVVEVYNKLLPANNAQTQQLRISQDDVYIVWFTKTLQNWKALVSTAVADDHLYFEVTYDGDTKQAYVDAYDKVHNEAIPDVTG